jgi:hypothetical protein
MVWTLWVLSFSVAVAGESNSFGEVRCWRYLGNRGKMLMAHVHIATTLRPNDFIDWTANGGQRLCHSSTTAAPFSPNHRQR